MAKVLAQYGQPQPSYAFDDLVSGHGTEFTRKLLWQKIDHDDMLAISRKMEMKWKDVLMQLPLSVQGSMAMTASEEFRRELYIEF